MKKKIKNILEPVKYLFLIVFAIGVFSDIFLFKISLGLMIPFIFILWPLIVWLFEFSAKISFYLSLTFLLIIMLVMIFKLSVVPNKASVWLYLFLFWAVVQQLITLLKDSKR